MIAKIASGKDTAGLIRYLFDTKKAKDHTDPHLIASWDGFAPDPGRADDFDATKKRLVADLDLRVKQARRLSRVPERHVWHCSVRAAPGDRHLTDAEWADIARRIVAATGIAPQGDPDGCRWVAVRHAEDHIHIAATKVRGDLRTARLWNDYLQADSELAAIEKEYGLLQVVRGDRTAAKRPTRAEMEKARRAGTTRTSRERLRTTVRQLVSIAASPEEFLHLFDGVEGVLVDVQHFPSGDVRGYAVAVEGDTNAAGEPIWFSGAKLAPDLSFPKIRERLTAIEAPPAAEPGSRRRPNPWYQATAAAERIPHHLDHGDDAAAQPHIAAFGEAIDVLSLLAPSHLRPQLQQAATAFERATRSRVHPQQDQARALRGAVRALRTVPVTGDGSGLAMFLDVAVLVIFATARWHQARRHDQQVAAAHQALVHLQAVLPTGCCRATGRPGPAPTTGPHHGTARPADPRDRARTRSADPRRPRLAGTGRRPDRIRDRRPRSRVAPPACRPPAHPGRRPLHRQDPHLAHPTPRRPAGPQRQSTSRPSPHERCSTNGTAWPDPTEPFAAWACGTFSTPVIPALTASLARGRPQEEGTCPVHPQVSHTAATTQRALGRSRTGAGFLSERSLPGGLNGRRRWPPRSVPGEGTASPHRADQRLQQLQRFLPAEAIHRATGSRSVRFARADQDAHPLQTVQKGQRVTISHHAGGGLRKPGLAQTHALVLAAEPGTRGTAREVMRPLPCRAPVDAAASGCGRRTVEVPRASRTPAATPGRPRRETNPGPPQWSARRRVGIMPAAVEATQRELVAAGAAPNTRAGPQLRRGEA